MTLLDVYAAAATTFTLTGTLAIAVDVIQSLPTRNRKARP